MNLETKITIYKFTPQLFTLTRGPSINYITDIHLHAKSNNKPFSPRMTNVNILWTGAI